MRIDPREKPGYVACTIAVSNFFYHLFLFLFCGLLCWAVSVENF
jgi:hypothetical protein